MREAAEGIDFLSAQGIYHRDIKPQNLLLFYGRVKLADLGLMKLTALTTASHTGSGTLGYCPPEAYDDRWLHPTIDLYGLAATYVKLRTDQEPFSTNHLEIAERQKAGNPIPEGLQAEEAELVRRALAFRPEERPQEKATPWIEPLYRALIPLAAQGPMIKTAAEERPGCGR